MATDCLDPERVVTTRDQCSALTTKGTRCQNIVADPAKAKWISFQSKKFLVCHTHNFPSTFRPASWNLGKTVTKFGEGGARVPKGDGKEDCIAVVLSGTQCWSSDPTPLDKLSKSVIQSCKTFVKKNPLPRPTLSTYFQVQEAPSTEEFYSADKRNVSKSMTAYLARNPFYSQECFFVLQSAAAAIEEFWNGRARIFLKGSAALRMVVWIWIQTLLAKPSMFFLQGVAKERAILNEVKEISQTRIIETLLPGADYDAGLVIDFPKQDMESKTYKKTSVIRQQHASALIAQELIQGVYWKWIRQTTNDLTKSQQWDEILEMARVRTQRDFIPPKIVKKITDEQESRLIDLGKVESNGDTKTQQIEKQTIPILRIDNQRASFLITNQAFEHRQSKLSLPLPEIKEESKVHEETGETLPVVTGLDLRYFLGKFHLRVNDTSDQIPKSLQAEFVIDLSTLHWLSKQNLATLLKTKPPWELFLNLEPHKEKEQMVPFQGVSQKLDHLVFQSAIFNGVQNPFMYRFLSELRHKSDSKSSKSLGKYLVWVSWKQHLNSLEPRNLNKFYFSSLQLEFASKHVTTFTLWRLLVSLQYGKVRTKVELTDITLSFVGTEEWKTVQETFNYKRDEYAFAVGDLFLSNMKYHLHEQIDLVQNAHNPDRRQKDEQRLKFIDQMWCLYVRLNHIPIKKYQVSAKAQTKAKGKSKYPVEVDEEFLCSEVREKVKTKSENWPAQLGFYCAQNEIDLEELAEMLTFTLPTEYWRLLFLFMQYIGLQNNGKPIWAILRVPLNLSWLESQARIRRHTLAEFYQSFLLPYFPVKKELDEFVKEFEEGHNLTLAIFGRERLSSLPPKAVGELFRDLGTEVVRKSNMPVMYNLYLRSIE